MSLNPAHPNWCRSRPSDLKYNPTFDDDLNSYDKPKLLCLRFDLNYYDKETRRPPLFGVQGIIIITYPCQITMYVFLHISYSDLVLETRVPSNSLLYLFQFLIFTLSFSVPPCPLSFKISFGERSSIVLYRGEIIFGPKKDSHRDDTVVFNVEEN